MKALVLMRLVNRRPGHLIQTGPSVRHLQFLVPWQFEYMMSSTTTQHVSTKKILVKDLVKDLLGSWDCDSVTDRLRGPNRT